MVGFATTCDTERTDIPEVATTVSVDDHLIEPEDTFVGRLPGKPRAASSGIPRRAGEG